MAVLKFLHPAFLIAFIDDNTITHPSYISFIHKEQLYLCFLLYFFLLLLCSTHLTPYAMELPASARIPALVVDKVSKRAQEQLDQVLYLSPYPTNVPILIRI